jgi:hypothetical protein
MNSFDSAKSTAYKKEADDRKNSLSTVGNFDDLAGRVALYPKSELTLSNFIAKISEGDENVATKALTDYGNVVSDDTILVQLGQEKLSSTGFASFKSQAEQDISTLNSKLSECRSYLSQCQDYRSQGYGCSGPSNNGGGGGYGNGNDTWDIHS